MFIWFYFSFPADATAPAAIDFESLFGFNPSRDFLVHDYVHRYGSIVCM